MLFNSFEFIYIFLPGTLLFYYIAGRFHRRTYAIVVLALCSLCFYGYWDWHFVFLLIASVVCNFVFGAMLQRQRRKWLLVLGISFNLGLLGFFKYTDFFLANISKFVLMEFEPLDFALPLGISFFTFQQIAFLVDTYKGKAEEVNFVRYSLFVSFFPQLIAGPIVHHKEMMPQFEKPIARRFNADNFSIGLLFFTIGLTKKVLIADSCAPWANAVFDCQGDINMLEAWVGALAYTMQLYFDFSGYSDMAIGLGKFFNIDLPQNFNSPYKSASIGDFWRRWHITLGRFLRNYLYIPLGGNRVGRGRLVLNVMVTFLLGGLWHGANWTFVAWGGYHGALLVLGNLWSRLGISLPRQLARGLTFLAVLFGWVLFRSESMDRAREILGSMVDIAGFRTDALALIPGGWQEIGVLVLLLIFVNFAPNSSQWANIEKLEKRYAMSFGILFFLCMLGMHDAVLNNVPTEFLYFNF